MRMTRQGALPITLVALLCMQAGCGEESTSGSGDTDGGDGGDAGGNGGGSGDGGGGALADDSAGTPCSEDADCGPAGTCAAELTGGNASLLGLQPLPADGGYCSASCSEDADCGAGGVCFGAVPLLGGGECRSACDSDDDCRDGYECAIVDAGEQATATIPSSCQPRPDTDQLGDDEAGKLCESDDDCPNGRCDGGLCTGDCTQDSHCGAGGTCIPLGYGSLGYCVEGCSSTDDCQNAAMGYGCSAEGRCVTRLAEGKVGEPCSGESETEDCPGGRCRETFFVTGTQFPGGYCVGDCDLDADCGAGGVCINATTCLKGCASGADCREGYECTVHPLADDTSTSSVCYPAEESSETNDGGVGEAGTEG